MAGLVLGYIFGSLVVAAFHFILEICVLVATPSASPQAATHGSMTFGWHAAMANCLKLALKHILPNCTTTPVSSVYT
jgi:hypothetical protein